MDNIPEPICSVRGHPFRTVGTFGFGFISKVLPQHHNACVVCTDRCQKCSNRGNCTWGRHADGTCVCNQYTWSPDCSKDCPGGIYNPCSGHGTCDDGALGSGQCTCEFGWYSAVCLVLLFAGSAALANCCKLDPLFIFASCQILSPHVHCGGPTSSQA